VQGVDSVQGVERWRDKVAFVTGASSGIGRAAARKLSRAGLRVAVCGRRKERLAVLAAELGQGSVMQLPVDLTRDTSLLRAFDRVRDQWGGVDVLVNNAGVGFAAPLVSGKIAEWREMLDVNVLSLCIGTREAVRQMRERGGEGHIFHVSSLAAYRVLPGGGVYAATKAAVRSLTESLRLELREIGAPIRVTAVSPGYVQTEFHAGFFGQESLAVELYSRHRTLEPDDVADAVMYALGAPPHVQVHDILLRSSEQPT
jgi:NADP-dependent 3-hydroxy acid dehydrogenase YdfG